MGSSYAIWYIIGCVIWGIIWGVAAKSIATNKGYENEASNWFWLGFFFSFIAIIVIATKPDNNSQNKADSTSNRTDNSPYGGWKCKNCGRVHQGYESTCICGAKKDEPLLYKEKTDTASKRTENNSHMVSVVSETERVKLIKDYKELLDSGIITQEEFEKKKSLLLWGETIPLDDKMNISDSCDNGISVKAEENNVNHNNQKRVRLLSTDNELFGICPECGARQRKSRTSCYKCGIPLKTENS